MFPYPAKRRRSLRLEKKLHIKQFAEFGFAYTITYTQRPTADVEGALLDQLLAQFIEPQSLVVGGGIDGGYIAGERNRIVTDADRAAFEAFCRANLPLATIEVEALSDAWYLR